MAIGLRAEVEDFAPGGTCTLLSCLPHTLKMHAVLGKAELRRLFQSYGPNLQHIHRPFPAQTKAVLTLSQLDCQLSQKLKPQVLLKTGTPWGRSQSLKSARNRGGETRSSKIANSSSELPKKSYLD